MILKIEVKNMITFDDYLIVMQLHFYVGISVRNNCQLNVMKLLVTKCLLAFNNHMSLEHSLPICVFVFHLLTNELGWGVCST